jgi:phosphoglycolate phosphatase
MHRKKKLFVCDWDGTISNSIPYIITCKQEIAEILNIAIPSETLIKSCVGAKLDLVLAKCFPSATVDEIERIKQLYEQKMRLRPRETFSLFPNVITTFNTLQQKGYLFAIATSKPRNEFEVEVRLYDFNRFISLSYCGTDFFSKPHPEVLFYILNELKMTVEEAIFIGDSIIDAELALNAQMDFIAVSFGVGDVSVLQAYNPIKTIDDWNELLGIL